MKRRNFLAIVMVAVMLLVGGCGNQKTEEDSIKDTATTVSSDATEDTESTETVESSAEVKQEEVASQPEAVDIDALIVEKTDEELDLKQYMYSYEDRTLDKEGEKVFNISLFDTPFEKEELIFATGNIDIYNINGIRVGYAVPNAILSIFGSYDGWYYFYLDGNQRFARVEDVDANIKTKEEIKNDEKIAEDNMQKHEQSSVSPESSVNVPVEQPVESIPAEQPVETPAESDKYTPEEAIAVYRSLMEAGGMTWNPGLKDVSSWGTGIMYLDKGYPELVASSDLEACAMGDTVGNPYTEYYLEITGSDNECVYFTGWHN